MKKYFAFASSQAEELWTRIDNWFPEGKWTTVKLPGALAKAWRTKFDALLAAAADFKGDTTYNKDAAKAARDDIVDKLRKWSKPDGLAPQDIATALANCMGRLMDALPDLGQLSKSKMLRPGVKDAIESFADSSTTILKNVAVGLESRARQSSGDPDLSWQGYAETMALMRFRDTALTMKKWTGDLPDDLRIADGVDSMQYFTFIAGNITGVDNASPVKVEELASNLGQLSDFDEGMSDASSRTRMLKALSATGGLLEQLGSTLVSDSAATDRKQKTAWETMVYLDCLNDVFGVQRTGTQTIPFGKRFSDETAQDFQQAASTALDEIDRQEWKERWKPRDTK